jgi:hypothetical protein
MNWFKILLQILQREFFSTMKTVKWAVNRNEPIQVLSITWWHHGQSNFGGSTGLSSQVTKCCHQGVVFYVRENVNGIPSFNISSGERWGDKIGRKPRMDRQVLELACPPEYFDQLADLVRSADPLGRPVTANNRFTVQWAEMFFKSKSVL